MGNDENYIYSLKELCDIFEIKENTFPSIARRFNLNSNPYSKMLKTKYNARKRYYNRLAYEKLEEYTKEKIEKSNNVYINTRENEIYKYIKEIEKLNNKIEILETEKAQIKSQLEEKEKKLEISNSNNKYLNSKKISLEDELNLKENENGNLKNYISELEEKINIENDKKKKSIIESMGLHKIKLKK